MKTKEEISKYLQDQFDNVYCYNCKYHMEDNRCDECHRKSMLWSLDADCADEMAEKILS